MPFYAVVAPREDGDADCLAAFDVDVHADMSKSALDLARDYIRWGEVPNDAEIILIENVTSGNGAGCGSMLIAWGNDNVKALERMQHKGKLWRLS